MRNLKILFSYLGAYRRDAILGVMFVSVETALELFIPVIMANIIDVGVPTGDVNYMLLQGAWLLSNAYSDTLFPMGIASPCGSVLSTVICVVAFTVLNRRGAFDKLAA